MAAKKNVLQDRSHAMQTLEVKLNNLTKSPLYPTRIKNQMKPVLGEGSLSADLMFIGEAPGRNEAKTGRPFCGNAGKILDELLHSVGIKREDIFITNIVKDRPPNNRDPLPAEIQIYGPLLDRQIEIIQPKVLVTLGRYAMEYIFKQFHLDDVLKAISLMHGKMFTAKTSYGLIKIIPLYHPAVAIYNYKTKDVLKEDFKILKSNAISK